VLRITKIIPGKAGQMSAQACIILGMTTKWNKYSYLNTDNDCLIEVTHLEGTEEKILHTPLNEHPYILLSVEDATITPNYERNKMAILDNLEASMEVPYNPNLLVTYKSINDNYEATYPTIKVVDLEGKLDSLVRLEKQLTISNDQIRRIINNLTVEGWYNPNVDKEDVLRDLCEILDHEAKQDITITATVQVEVTYACPLDEVEDFDAKYFLQDNLTIDSWHGDVVIESYDVEDADVNW
jgi:hypothetical protein